MRLCASTPRRGLQPSEGHLQVPDHPRLCFLLDPEGQHHALSPCFFRRAPPSRHHHITTRALSTSPPDPKSSPPAPANRWPAIRPLGSSSRPSWKRAPHASTAAALDPADMGHIAPQPRHCLLLLGATCLILIFVIEVCTALRLHRQKTPGAIYRGGNCSKEAYVVCPKPARRQHSRVSCLLV